MTTAQVFAEALEGYTARLGEPQREHNLARWKRPDGELCLIEWPVYGFVELAAITSDGQRPWFLSEPGAAFVARFGVHPVVDAGSAVVQACDWLREATLRE